MARAKIAMAILLGLMMLPSLSLTAGAEPIMIDHFNDDVAEATLDFVSSLTNDTLTLDLPSGATIRAAELSLDGIGGASASSSVLDFLSGTDGVDVWANYNEGKGIYPPVVNPYMSRWLAPGNREWAAIQKEDNSVWETATTDNGAPPFAWPIQLYRFKPNTIGASMINVSWKGQGYNSMNKTNTFHAEMWLYNHTDSKWIFVKDYGSMVKGYVWLNYTIDMPSPFVSSEGVIPVAMCGIHSQWAGPMLPAFDVGRVTTDYIRVKVVSSGDITYPEDLVLSIDGTDVATVPGNLTGSVRLDSTFGFGANLQSVLDTYPVTPDNVTLRFDFTVLRPTAGKLAVSDLIIMYDPVVNLAPEYVGPKLIEIMEDAPWTAVLDLDATFDDDHNNGLLEFELPPFGSFPELPIPMDWRLGSAPGGNTTLEIKPTPDFYGDFPFEWFITAEDTFGLRTDAWLNFTILPVGDKPMIVYPGVLPAHERTPFNYTINVTDVDLPDDLFVFSEDSDLFEINATTGDILWTPASDQIGSHSFHVTVEDSYGLSDTVLMTINVQNSNDPPVITSVLQLSSKQGVEASYIVRAEDPDVPFGDQLQYFAFADAIDVQVDLATGRLTFIPTNDHVPEFDITIRVQDKVGELDEKMLHITVENVNDPPMLADYQTRTVDQNAEVTLQLEAIDPDMGLDIPEVETITFAGSGKEAFLPDADGLIQFTADQSLVGTHTVTYTVTDRAGAKDITTIMWVVRDVNDLPGVDVTGIQDGLEATEDTPFSFEMKATDLDGDTLTWSDDSNMFDIDPSTGTIEFTPTQADVGVHSVSVTVRDGNGGDTVVTFDLTVLNVNDLPVILTVLPESGSGYTEDDTIEFSATAEDEDADDLTYTWKDGDKVLGTGPLLGVDDLSAGSHTITLSVEDGQGGIVTYDLKVEVEATLGGSLMTALLIIVVLVVIVGAILFMRARQGGRTAATEDSEGPDETAAEKLPADGKERIVSFGPAQAIEFKPGEAPIEAPEVLQDEGVIVHEEDAAPTYDLESAREYHVGSEEVAEPDIVEKEE